MATKKATSPKKKNSTTKKPIAKKTTTSHKIEEPVIVEQEVLEVSSAPVEEAMSAEIDDKPTMKMTIGEQFSALKPSALIAEFLGTFVLSALVINLSQNKYYGILGISIGLVILVMILGNISGAHLNPAITIASYINRKTNGVKAIAYIVVQILGAVLAFVVLHAIFTSTYDASVVTALTNQGYGSQVTQAGGLEAFAKAQGTTVATLAKYFGVSSFNTVSIADGQGWSTFFSELIGAIIFGLGVGFAFFQKNKSHVESGLAVGLGLFGGLAVGGSVVILNPAVAGALSAFSHGAMFGSGAGTFWLSLAVYALATTIGMTIGVTAYRFILKDAAKK